MAKTKRRIKKHRAVGGSKKFQKHFSETFGTHPKRYIGDVATNILIGAATGAVMSGIGTGAHLAYRKVRKRG
jgi:hypothetical protein